MTNDHTSFGRRKKILSKLTLWLALACPIHGSVVFGQENTRNGAVLGGLAGAVVGGVVGHNQKDQTAEGATDLRPTLRIRRPTDCDRRNPGGRASRCPSTPRPGASPRKHRRSRPHGPQRRERECHRRPTPNQRSRDTTRCQRSDPTEPRRGQRVCHHGHADRRCRSHHRPLQQHPVAIGNSGLLPNDHQPGTHKLRWPYPEHLEPQRSLQLPNLHHTHLQQSTQQRCLEYHP